MMTTTQARLAAQRNFGSAVPLFLIPLACLTTLSIAACSTDSRALSTNASDTTTAPLPTGPSLLDGVRNAPIPDDVKSACDTAMAAIGRGLQLSPGRRDGTYTDSFHGETRLGCRILVDGSFKQSNDPIGAVEVALQSVHWTSDARITADGPDGSVIGVRRRDVLCIISGSWDGGDDSDTVPAPGKAPDGAFTIVADCAADVVPIDAQLGLPEWATDALKEPTFSARYSVSPRVRFPPAYEGDFDGDGIPDVAVLIEERGTSRRGLVVVAGSAAHALSVVGIPADASAPDLAWAEDVQLFHGGAINAGIDIPQPADMRGDALYLTDVKNRAALMYWNGAAFTVLPLPA